MTRPADHRRYERRASVYLAVLGSTMLVMLIGLAALAAVRIQREKIGRSEEAIQARLLAQSGIEWALTQMGQGQSWRTRMPAEDWVVEQAFAGGTMTVTATDPVDSDIATGRTDPLMLLGLGKFARAQYLLQVKLLPVPGPLAALATCLHAQGNITVFGGASLTVSGGALSSNADVISDGVIYGNVEAARRFGYAPIYGQLTVPAASKLMPQTSLVSAWISKATSVGFLNYIDRQAWGPGFTPGGFTNIDGVYYINAGNNDLVIRQSRIYGTLVVRCPGKKVEIENPVFMESYRRDYPVLIVDGSIELYGYGSNVSLSEYDAGSSLNRPGVPYNGQFDFDTWDNYPNEIRGLVYATQGVTFNSSSRIVGPVLCHSRVYVNASPTFVYDPRFYNSPPEGFLDPAVGMAIKPGSWQRMVLP